jgi:homoserine O-succinyltransferase
VPVLLNIRSDDHHLLGGSGARKQLVSATNEKLRPIDVGLINNMPDSALVSTERQIFELLDAAAGDLPVRLHFYALASVPRDDWGRKYVGRFYSDVINLWDRKLDGLIVTGAEPKAANLKDEPYWNSLGQVINWASENTTSSIWSCLAVHSAVLHADGINRHELREKRIGVFSNRTTGEHPLLQGVPSQILVPHSRWNEVREEALVRNGYTILTTAKDAGVDMFVKQQKRSLFVHFQGHLEYEAQSLLGEYRRDIGRFLRGEIDQYPTMPKGYFDHNAERVLSDFQKRAVSDRRSELFSKFPVDRAALNLSKSWHLSARRIYENWIAYIFERRARLEPPRG